MRALVQRVNKARLLVEEREVSYIGYGMVCYLGVGRGDDEKQLIWLARKVAGLRIFPDKEGKMNLSAIDIGADILCVSQFTLYGDVRNGYRPGFSQAEKPDVALKMYDDFCNELEKLGVKKVAKGIFAADMTIEQENQGPVTLMLDTDARKL